MIYVTPEQIYEKSKGKEVELWAFNFKKCSNKSSNNKISKPYKCRISVEKRVFGNINQYHSFWGFCKKLKSNGEVSKSGEVHFDSRVYADTHEEAVIGYNSLIDDANDVLRDQISENVKEKM